MRYRILILKSFSVFKLIMIIKRKLKLKPTEAIYIYSGKTLLQSDQKLENVYEKYAN